LISRVFRINPDYPTYVRLDSLTSRTTYGIRAAKQLQGCQYD